MISDIVFKQSVNDAGIEIVAGPNGADGIDRVRIEMFG